MSNKWKANRIIFYEQLLKEKNELKKMVQEHIKNMNKKYPLFFIV